MNTHFVFSRINFSQQHSEIQEAGGPFPVQCLYLSAWASFTTALKFKCKET